MFVFLLERIERITGDQRKLNAPMEFESTFPAFWLAYPQLNVKLSSKSSLYFAYRQHL